MKQVLTFHVFQVLPHRLDIPRLSMEQQQLHQQLAAAAVHLLEVMVSLNQRIMVKAGTYFHQPPMEMFKVLTVCGDM